ncbi:heavy-metal-associated domain-containing protein [Romboutsia sp. 13368]|uniref:heavy-metal-associated domain-containing protein n=1 Tax=Romboutsia sp. 13368 TaxID=2708053 RepID=UPI0025DF59CC|nr:heavy metal-associated domain-containing protein [Romboutsia sp. 13368]
MRKKLIIDGMSCNHCVNHLNTALSEDIDGIEVIEISLEDKFAIVDMNSNVDLNKLNEVVEELGFELKDIIEY